MARPRRQHQAEDAAKAASEAARVLQQRGQEVKENVQNTEPPEDWVPPKRYSDHRTEMMEEIVASRPGANKEPVEEPKPEPKPEPEQRAEEPKEEPKVEVQETVEPPAPKTYKAKVDGEEYDVPEEEVEAAGGLRAWQRDKAAENRLKKANEGLAEIRRAQAETEQARLAAQKPKEPEVTDEQFIAERIDKIRFGSPEESAAALKEILSRSQKPAVDPNEIIQRANGQFWHDQAVRQFDKDFQDLVTNSDLLDLVVVKRNKKLAQLKGAPADWGKFYSDLGNEVRSIVGKPTSTTTQSTTSGTPSQQSKEERKAAAAVSVPTSAARAAPPKEEKPETREDMLRQMRKSRGLPVD